MKEFIMVLDTETIGADKRFVYDIGFIIAKMEEGVYIPIEKKQFIVEQIYDNKALFETAYYYKKRPKYVSMLKGRTAVKTKIGYITQSITQTIKKYGIEKVFAYNSSFDKGVFEFNSNFFNIKNPLEESKWKDIHGIAGEFIHKTEAYQKFAEENKRYGTSGRIETNAEVTYGYLVDDPNYIEEHTSLQDCEIELDILNECIRKGYDCESEYKSPQIKTEEQQTLRIIKNEKVYNFTYKSRRNTKKGIVLKD